MQVTYFGHSCFEVLLHGKKLLFDPFIRSNPLAAHIDVSALKPDYVLVTHGHEDHVADVLEICRQSGATLIANWEIVQWFSKQGVQNVHPMNIGGKWMFDFGKVKCVSAVHSSSMPDGSYGGNPMGFIIEAEEGNFYYAGDTALTYDMKLIGEYRSLDFAFLPIGDNFTMSADNAILAAEFIRCRKIIGMHYNTFDFITIDTEAARRNFETNGCTLILPGIGEKISM